jgi:hypothetical protein
MSLSNAEAASLPQGDLRLLGTATAQRLLTAPLVARLAYAGQDGTPRLIPVNVLWTSEEVVIGAFAGTYKVRYLRAQPDVAICIDTADGPPQVLMLRGKVTLAEVPGRHADVLHLPLDLSTMFVPTGVAYLAGITGTDIRTLSAGTALSLVPVVVFFILLQRQVLEGAKGAVNG